MASNKKTNTVASPENSDSYSDHEFKKPQSISYLES